MRRAFLACLCTLALLSVQAAVSAVPAWQGRTTAKINTWTARSSTGQVFAGTWTVAPAVDAASAGGTWTLDNAQRRTVARGTWSASKTANGWTGAWRASTTGSPAAYAGTWSASLTLGGSAPFARLFEAAAAAAVSGTWRASALSGSWSIRVFN